MIMGHYSNTEHWDMQQLYGLDGLHSVFIILLQDVMVIIKLYYSATLLYDAFLYPVDYKQL